MPSYRPTVLSTSSPVGAASPSTAKPTMSRPSSLPSSSKVVSIHFQSTLNIIGVSAISLSSSPTAQSAICLTATIPVNGISPSVTAASFTSWTSNVTLVLTASAHVTLSTSFVLPLRIGTEMSTTYISSVFYDTYTTALKSKIGCGNFTQILQSNGGILRHAYVTSSQFTAYSGVLVLMFLLRSLFRPTVNVILM